MDISTNGTVPMKNKCAYTELVPIENLTPNPKNNNRHSIEQIERLAKVIKFQGMRSPIVVSKRSGFIVKGHCRLEALKLIDAKTAPVDYQDYENEAQEYADMTADNELARWAEFDYHQHMLVMEENEWDIDTQYFGLKEYKGDVGDFFADQDPSKNEDREDDYLDRAPRQIILMFTQEEYKDVGIFMKTLMDKYNVKTNKEVFLKLLENEKNLS